MSDSSSPGDDEEASAIEEFNKAVKKAKKYNDRRDARTTPTIFFDSEIKKSLIFRSSPEGWCTVPPEYIQWLASKGSTSLVIPFDRNTISFHYTRRSFIGRCKEETRGCLELMTRLYLDAQSRLAQNYDQEKQAIREEAIADLRLELRDKFCELAQKPSIIDYVKQRLRVSRKEAEPIPSPTEFRLIRKRSEAEVMELMDDKQYSMKALCKLCIISPTRYYTILGHKKLKEESKDKNVPPPRPKGSVSPDDLEKIKKLADDPQKSYTVPEMREAMFALHGRELTKKAIAYHLNHTLGYSYKRNHFKPFSAFQSPQKGKNFRAAKQFLTFNEEGKNVICIDEAGFHLGVQKEYSYAKRGTHPFRVKRQSVTKLHIIMAITNQEVFAYQMRKKGHNELSFIAFIIDVVKKIHELGPDYESKAVLFLDNASYHTSELAGGLLNFLPFPVFFNAPNWSDLNPIESAFSIIKARLKKRNPTHR